MEGTPKAIEPKGIVRNATKIGVQDGQAEDLINLRFMDGSWRASGNGRQIVNMPTGTIYQQLYVHTNVYHHLLGVYEGTLYWFAEIGTDGTSFYPLDNTTSRTQWPEDMQDLPTAPVALTTVVGDIWITQTGHLLTIIDENDDFEHLVFKTGDNEYVEVNVDVNGKATDRKLFPFGQVYYNIITDNTSHYIHSEKDDTQYVVNDASDIDQEGSPACVPKISPSEDTTHAAAQIWHAQMLNVFNKALEANQFTSPFLVVAAIRLYDGSYAYATNPVLINPRELDTFNRDQEYAYIHNGQHMEGNAVENDAHAAKIKYGSKVWWTDEDKKNKLKYISGASTSSRVQEIAGSRIPSDIQKNTMESVVRGADLALSIENIDTLINNKNVFAGVDVFVTTQSYYYNMSAEGYKNGSVQIWTHLYEDAYGEDQDDCVLSEVSYIPPFRTWSEILYDLEHSPFYLLREYDIDEIEQFASEIKVDISASQYKGVLQNIIQQKRLDYEATNRTTYLPKVSYMYNGRLHIANYKTYPFFGYPIDLLHLHNHSVKVQANSWFKGVLPNLTGNNDDYLQYEKAQKAITNYADLVTAGAPYFLVKVYIDSSQGEQVVCRYIPAYNPSPAVNGRADFIEDLNPLLTYPDARAKKMEIYYVDNYMTDRQIPTLNGVYVKWQEFSLKPHPYLNIAYYIDPELKPIKLADFKNLRETQPLAVE